ncbi:MAG: GNAT family N-acetyltransferase [Cyanomargarita calcarea GSE-NOS-MK-12-04C]|jgi:RimJ/RimL family protein N-acetyltransferase|uniref:GNAT family N-acetyltransferase n=1 Tax=Cyanomargarita calcarea GSE-NOS-MK-12-04C TaxID=2839659 RepID=A0A951QS36_9CYAN|nr:GNAT family N-acetyltransferase [Cyanomargarita calcarea GSE-NOS-MK-12-04C]
MKVFLKTERLILRQFTIDDVDNVFRLDSDPVVIRFGSGGNHPSFEHLKNEGLPKWIKYYEQYENYGIWAAVEKSSHDFIGWFHFYPAIENKFGTELNIVNDGEIALGYRLLSASRGKGYATEGSHMLVSKGFNEWDVQRVTSWALADNKASIRVMEKVGLKFEKEFNFTEYQLPNLTASERKAVKYGLNKDN